MPDFVTKLVRGGFGPSKTSTFCNSDVIHLDQLKILKMEAPAFYLLYIYLSNRVLHDQIIQCTVILYSNVKETFSYFFYPQVRATFWSEHTKSQLPGMFQLYNATYCCQITLGL